jgi:hypothetical protein
MKEELAATKEELTAIKQLLEHQYQANTSTPPNTGSWPLGLSLDGQPKEQT